MAVARPELTISEIDWLVEMIEAGVKATGRVPVDQRRGLREMKRARDRGHEQAERERVHLARVRASFRTAPERQKKEEEA